MKDAGEKSTKRYRATKSREVGVDPLKKGMALVEFPIFEMPEGIWGAGRGKAPVSAIWSGYITGRNTVLLA